MLVLKYLEWFTVLVILVSMPVTWELWRRPLQTYVEQEDLMEVREGNCRKAMATGLVGSGCWGGLLLLRVSLRGQQRNNWLRWIPLALVALMISALVRMVMATQIYPWYFD